MKCDNSVGFPKSGHKFNLNLVEFEDFSKNNKIIINNTDFSDNLVIANAENGYGTSGVELELGLLFLIKKVLSLTQLCLKIARFLGTKLCGVVGLDYICHLNQMSLMLLTH